MNIKNVILSIIAVSFISSCSLPVRSFENVTPTVTETPQPSVTPTATPIPIPTATPTPEPSARLSMAEAAFNQGDYDTALDDYQQVIRYVSDTDILAAAQLGLAKIYLKSEKAPLALTTLQTLLEQYPISTSGPYAHYYIAQIYSGLERYTEAADEYQKYLDLRPGILDSYIQNLRGDALNSSEQYMDAISAWQASLTASHLGSDSATQLKIARAYASTGDYSTALGLYDSLFKATTDDYLKAELDLLSGQANIALGDTTTAYNFFNDAVNNYPRSYDSYSALSALINAGITVDPLNRGIVDYYAGQYLPAIDVLKEYIKNEPGHDGTAHYYLALCYTNQEEYETAISEWDALIHDHKGDRFWTTAWDEKAYLQWYYYDRYEAAAQTLLDFVSTAPTDPQAPNYLFEAGRIYERGNILDKASATWDRLATEYPAADRAYLGIYMSGITHYRAGNYADALQSFQRGLLLADAAADKASASLWIGKAEEKLGDAEAAQTAWQQAAAADPTGYYSERARDLLLNRAPFTNTDEIDLGFDLNTERPEAETWMRNTFNLTSDVNLNASDDLVDDPRMIRGDEFLKLGLPDQARDEYEDLRNQYQLDAVATYKLTNLFLARGMTRPAVFAARQVLNLAGMDDTATFQAPVYFNHIRFGPYYKDIVLQTAKENDQDPLLLFALIRQESLFEPFVSSSAGAEGLTQLMPATAKEIAANYGWPDVVTPQDVYRPLVSIRLGAYYLNQLIDQSGGDVYAALAAYNAGLSSANTWKSLSGEDPDLFLESIRYEETRNYIRSIVELNNIYRRFYTRAQ
jgi:soluble lytic murein transglycosylase